MGLAVGLLATGLVADGALRRQARAEERAVRADARGRARLLSASVRAELARMEEAVAAGSAGEGVAARRLRVPPPISVVRHAVPPYGQREPAQLALLVGSSEATPSGLPEAVVAALALGSEESEESAGKALLEGRLPVRPADLPLLAKRLGLAGEPGVAALVRVLHEWEARDVTPGLPAFARSLEDGRLVGWSREGPELLRYELALESLAGRTGLPAEARLEALGEASARGRLLVDVEGVGGLVLSVPLAEVASVLPLRAGLWALFVLLAAIGLFALESLRRQRAAVEREREFLTMVSHEMRTPLASVRVLGETLADGRGEPKEYGELIAREGLRLTGLVEGVLAAARAEERAELARVQPSALLRDAAELVRPRALGRGVDLEVGVEDLPTVHWDAERVRRAVLGLLDNALRHGCREGGRCSLTAEADEREVRIAVADDGPGIRRADAKRLFGRFERAGETAGTGLGLWLVEQCAAAHGGRLELDADAGRGARFTLHLPIEPPAGEAAP